MPIFREPFRGRTVPESIREQQMQEFAAERESVLGHVAEAKRMVRDLLSRDARILVVDVAQGGFDPSRVTDPGLVADMRELQFGGDELSHGAIFRHLLGFEPGDDRITIWDVARDPGAANLPFPDAWIATGGPAMPSEMLPGNETDNTHWLQRASESLRKLSELRVPGVAVCLGHQLFHAAHGVEVRKFRSQREIGTVGLTATELGQQLQLLYGFWGPAGQTEIMASHSQEAAGPAVSMEVVAFNDYADYQVGVKPLREGQSVLEADAEDELVLSLQNHPELLARYLEVLRELGGEQIAAEGINLSSQVFRNTPQVRSIWHRFIELAARRSAKR